MKKEYKEYQKELMDFTYFCHCRLSFTFIVIVIIVIIISCIITIIKLYIIYSFVWWIFTCFESFVFGFAKCRFPFSFLFPFARSLCPFSRCASAQAGVSAWPPFTVASSASGEMIPKNAVEKRWNSPACKAGVKCCSAGWE